MPDSAPIQSRSQLIQSLQQQIARLEGARHPTDPQAVVPTGLAALDELLPERGFRRGSLVEWLADGDATGRQTLALYTAREAAREGGAVVILDRARQLYPPAVIGLGIPLQQIIVVCAGSQSDDLWALDQSLRCPAVAAVLAWPEKLDGHTFRRLQLAAEEGGGLGLLLRPAAVRQEPSWAEVRLWVEPLPGPTPQASRRLKIQVLRCPHRAGSGSREVEVELGHETHRVHPTLRLARRAAPRRAAGA